MGWHRLAAGPFYPLGATLFQVCLELQRHLGSEFVVGD